MLIWSAPLYSLKDLAFHGTSDFLKDVELRNVTAVIDPAKAAVPKPTSAE
jgi:hypothetical protein